MYNQLKILILLILIFLVLFIIYMLMDTPKTLKIESIQIEPIKISSPEVKMERNVEKKPLVTLPVDILSKLRMATKQSKEAMVYSKKEQSIEEQVVKKVVIKKVPTKIKTIKKKIITQRKIVIKKEAKAKVKMKVNKPKKSTKPIKTFITSTKELQPPKKKIMTQKVTKILSREEEVALYNKKYSNTLEVVNVTDNFEIKEEDILPDSHYFEPIIEIKSTKNNVPLALVEKLGVVNTSDNYENDFEIPQKIDLAKEGIVNFSNSSAESKELQKLEFVDSLGVINVSEDFETINAHEYLN